MTSTTLSSPYSSDAIVNCIRNFRQTTHIIYHPENQMMGLDQSSSPQDDGQVIGTLPGMYPEWLGDRSFLAAHNLRFAYVGGAMARGIASAELVVALGKMGAMGFFGAAGLPIHRTEEAILQIASELNPIGASWGVNIIHTPASPEEEDALIDLFLHHGVKRVSAAAFMGSSKALIRYACTGLTQGEDGCIRRMNYLFPKVSRPEVATHFLQAPPQGLLQALVAEGGITPHEAELAAQIPLAEDLTVESDSGGHTDSRPLNALFSAIAAQRDQLQKAFDFTAPVRLGAAGSLGTPESLAAAFALGASYVLLGSVHQASVESGLSPLGKVMLAGVDIADTIVTPSADMFEIGGKVQVVKKGTMMGVRGNRLLEIYNRYASVEEIPADVQSELEKAFFRDTIANIWTATQDFFQQIDPRELQRAEDSPKYKLALLFRWYLGNSSKWALHGVAERQLDFQIWCGPAMGAFNRWAKGSFLEDPQQRHIEQIALNLLEGASLHTRAQQCRCFGVPVPMHHISYIPQSISL